MLHYFSVNIKLSSTTSIKERISLSLGLKSTNIVKSFKMLKGNTRVSVLSDPAWAIPYTLYYFYLSLYMKSLGITDKQIGFWIAIEFITGSIISLFSGVIVDTLGRKKSTLIFDLICWPLVMVVYFFANSFWMFALGYFLHAFMRITLVSFNLMVFEDANNEQRVAAFSLLNIISIVAGVTTPLAGLLVRQIGIIKAERILLMFAAISTFIMMIIRHNYYIETKAGQEILDKKKKEKLSVELKNAIKSGPYKQVFSILRKKPEVVMVICVFILFNIYVPIGAHTSLYYVPYITEVLKIDTSAVSILGGINSVMMLLVNIFVIPAIIKHSNLKNMMWGLGFQILALCLFVTIPSASFFAASISVMFFAIGYSIFKPFVDAALAEYTDGDERSGIYSLSYTIISVLTAVMGLVSGYIYSFNPRLLYVLSLIILGTCIVILIILYKKNKAATIKPHNTKTLS
jgi:MFS family permease